MRVFLGTPRGFCAGVVRAIDVVELALEKYGTPLYIKHQIVHNPFVVKSLEMKGAVTVEDVDEIPEGSTVIFSAHGSPPEDFEKASLRNLHVIDATCPLVTKVHNEAHKYAKAGRKLLLVGHEGHQEVKGSMGQELMHLVSDQGERDIPKWEVDTPITVLTQTTLSVEDTLSAIDDIRTRFPNAIVRNDLCYATTNRQIAVQKLAESVDLILVIGAPESSNCNRLRDVARSNGVISHLINGPEDINPSWFSNINNIGITSGASTPEILIDAVVEAIEPDEIVTVRGAEEDVKFVLPSEFKDYS